MLISQFRNLQVAVPETLYKKWNTILVGSGFKPPTQLIHSVTHEWIREADISI